MMGSTQDLPRPRSDPSVGPPVSGVRELMGT